jgi:hypothetical protein
MGLSLPLPNAAALAAASTRFKAWWNGEPVPETNLALVDGDGSEPSAGVSDPARTRIVAAEAMWGPGRLWPGSDGLDVRMCTSLGLKKAGRLVLLGLDAGAAAAAIVKDCDARVEGFDTDPLLVGLGGEAATAAKLAKKITLKTWDGAPGSLPKNRAEGLIAQWQGTDAARVEAMVFAMARTLKPGASALWLDMFAARADGVEAAWSGSPARGFIEESVFLQALEPAGLTVRSEQDWTADLLNALEVTWARLREDWETCQASLIARGGSEAAAAALQEVVTWRARHGALANGRLTARRYVVALA